jgi:hypothetical protein
MPPLHCTNLPVNNRRAVCDRRDEHIEPPEPGMKIDVPLFVTAYNDMLTLYRDMSGDSLHR